MLREQGARPGRALRIDELLGEAAVPLHCLGMRLLRLDVDCAQAGVGDPKHQVASVDTR